jgi:hypothetical protein
VHIKSGLIRGVVFVERGIIRGVVFVERGIIRETTVCLTSFRN